MQRNLFPALEEEIGVLSAKKRQLVRILKLVNIRLFLAGQCWFGIGRKPHSRLALVKAFIAKAIWNILTTRDFIDRISSSFRRLRGWDRVCDIPHKSVFSRTFELFALRKWPANIHKTHVKGGAIFPAHVF